MQGNVQTGSNKKCSVRRPDFTALGGQSQIAGQSQVGRVNWYSRYIRAEEANVDGAIAGEIEESHRAGK